MTAFDEGVRAGIAKTAAMDKEGLRELIPHGIKAIKGAILGGKKLVAGGDGLFTAQRKAAVSAGEELMSGLKGKGVKVHRARVKSHASMAAKGLKEVPDDLLGMQSYSSSPEHAADVIKKLKAHGVENISHSVKARPGYHGVNVKGTYKGTPVEMQMSPGRMSNAGQQLEHGLGYKQKTEAPKANFIDKFFGKKIAPRMVQSGSWMNDPSAVARFNAAANS
jgi:hypothetical protein